MKLSVQQVLVAYSAVLSTTFAVVLLMGANSRHPHVFDEIQVHRIDVVEPDGTLRMVISNRDRLPGVIVKGKESPKVDRPGAGMLFYNNEGTENGGLVFGGHLNDKGEIVDSASVSPSISTAREDRLCSLQAWTIRTINLRDSLSTTRTTESGWDAKRMAQPLWR